MSQSQNLINEMKMCRRNVKLLSLGKNNNKWRNQVDAMFLDFGWMIYTHPNCTQRNKIHIQQLSFCHSSRFEHLNDVHFYMSS